MKARAIKYTPQSRRLGAKVDASLRYGFMAPSVCALGRGVCLLVTFRSRPWGMRLWRALTATEMR